VMVRRPPAPAGVPVAEDPAGAAAWLRTALA
jgi:precorrin-6A/cobalt-precorrin-6A reductase